MLPLFTLCRAESTTARTVNAPAVASHTRACNHARAAHCSHACTMCLTHARTHNHMRTHKHTHTDAHAHAHARNRVGLPLRRIFEQDTSVTVPRQKIVEVRQSCRRQEPRAYSHHTRRSAHTIAVNLRGPLPRPTAAPGGSLRAVP